MYSQNTHFYQSSRFRNFFSIFLCFFLLTGCDVDDLSEGNKYSYYGERDSACMAYDRDMDMLFKDHIDPYFEALQQKFFHDQFNKQYREGIEKTLAVFQEVREKTGGAAAGTCHQYLLYHNKILSLIEVFSTLNNIENAKYKLYKDAGFAISRILTHLPQPDKELPPFFAVLPNSAEEEKETMQGLSTQEGIRHLRVFSQALVSPIRILEQRNWESFWKAPAFNAYLNYSRWLKRNTEDILRFYNEDKGNEKKENFFKFIASYEENNSEELMAYEERQRREEERQREALRQEEARKRREEACIFFVDVDKKDCAEDELKKKRNKWFIDNHPDQCKHRHPEKECEKEFVIGAEIWNQYQKTKYN